MVYLWEEFLIEGDELFNYMKDNFETIFDGDEIIKHFDITYGLYDLGDKAKELNKQYSKEIQKELIPWIQNELKEGRLLDNTYWKPFRHAIYIEYMRLGYRKIFQYKNYYLQLSLEESCGICNYCNKDDVNRTHFELALYGWKDDGRFRISEDNMLPESFWKRT
jgi:hypothetical protein